MLGLHVAVRGQRTDKLSGRALVPVTGAESFEQLFEKRREIVLALGQETIGTIQKMEIGPEGQFLLLDTQLGDAFLVNRSGQLISKLSVETSQPGVRWHPLTACFALDGSILVWCGSKDLLVFDKFGKFKGKFDMQGFRAYRDFTIDAHNHLFAYTVTRNQFALTKIDFDGRELREGGVFPHEYHNYIYRMEEGGCIALDRAGYVYHTNVSGPEIYKYSNDLKLLRTFGRTPPFFAHLPKAADQVFIDPRRFPEVQKVMRTVTQNIHLHAVNDTLFLSQYLVMDEGRFALDIWSTTGRYYSSDKLRYRNVILAAKDNFVYTVFQPEADSQGNLPNPIIVEYKLLFRNAD